MNDALSNIAYQNQSPEQESHAFWEKTISDQEASGMKIKEYCQAHSLDRSSYYRWRDKLRKISSQEALVGEPGTQSRKSKQQEYHTYWTKILKEQEASGMEAREYCNTHGLKYDTFRQWRYRFNKKLKIENTQRAASKINFIPIALDEKPLSSSPIKLELTSGKISLLLEPSFDEMSLSKILITVGDYYARTNR